MQPAPAELLGCCLRWLGAYLLATRLALPLAWLLTKHLLLTRLVGRRRRLREFGDWAAVTGASDGIGRAYAKALAADGLNVALIARSEPKLRAVADDIQRSLGVRTRTIVADFADSGVYDGIERQLSDLRLACLVNNVGTAPPYPEAFAGPGAFDVRLFADMLNVNCLSMLSMTRIGLRLMRRPAGAGGFVVNVASATGVRPVPYLNVYSATKAFGNFFSGSVAAELRASADSGGVSLQNVLPMFVATKMIGAPGSSYFVPSPEKFVDEALNLLGVEETTYGCFAHSLQSLFSQLLPDCVNEAATSLVVARLSQATASAQCGQAA